MESALEEGLLGTLERWQPFYRERLTRDDAIEIRSNLVGVFEILMLWDARKRALRGAG